MPALSPYFRRKVGQPKYPHLWQGCVAAYCPIATGASGLTLFDYSGRNGHAALTTASVIANWTTDFGQRCVEIVSGDYFVGPSFNYANASISLWITATTPASGVFRIYISSETDISGVTGISIGQSDTNTFYGQMYGGYRFADAASSTAVRHHLVVTGSSASGTPRFWLDGVEQFGTSATATAATGGPLYIGKRNTVTFPFPSPSRITDLRIYSRILSDAEIKLLSRSPLVAYETLPPRIAVDTGGNLLDLRRRAIAC